MASAQQEDCTDLMSYLESWPYDKENNVRIRYGIDGREIILVRLPMGMEQYEIDGHPNSQRVHGMETVLDFHEARINAARQARLTQELELTAEDCAEFFHEAGAWLHRLNLLFRLKDWPRVERDVAHILRLLGFVRQHARCADRCVQLDLWHPRTTDIHAVARAMLLDKGHDRGAVQILHNLIRIPSAVDDGTPHNERFAEVPFESVRGSPADCPISDPREKSCFICQGDYWTIRYDGHTALLKSTRGLQFLAVLLRSPEREFHVSELIASLFETLAAGLAVTKNTRLEDDDLCITNGLNVGSPLLDSRAKAEYKSRVNELRQELEEAKQFNDPDRAVKTQQELDAIAQQLATAVGLGGHDRKTSSAAERARSTVTKRIKKAIQKIAGTSPALGHHLAARIKTGYFCSYQPDPDHAVNWKF